MRRMAAVSALGIVAVLALAAPASAAPVPFKIDPNHSQVSFAIRHFFSRVPGRFKEFSGTLLLDEKDLAKSSADVTIKAASIFTDNDERDQDLRSPHFFAVDSFPTLTFKSTKITAGEGGKLTIEGNLTMHGVTKPVVLQGTFMGAGSTKLGMGYDPGYRAGFEATTTIDRKDWGIIWNMALDKGGTMLGDDVAITIGVEAVRVEPPAAAKKP
jgi:polyisoprenoid-binding protein YceI